MSGYFYSYLFEWGQASLFHTFQKKKALAEPQRRSCLVFLTVQLLLNYISVTMAD